ncbi:MAG: hypothetical protein JWM65_3244 [Sphingomonas bacterium]|nr:hypothetical protein [Sphingomonas bacterium]
MAGSRAQTRDGDAYVRCLWAALAERMEEWRSDWRATIDESEADADIIVVIGPPARSDREIFEAFAVALLSGNTRWDRIERVRDKLSDPFQGFDPRAFAALPDSAIDRTIVPWFRERRAGAASLRAGLLRLRAAAGRLISPAGDHPVQSYIRAAFSASDGTPEGLAVVLGAGKAWKLPGFGIALAAEALRMLGLDLCKPDRHVMRAIGAWSLVDFRRWERNGAFTPPQASPVELRATMLAVRGIAEANGLGVSRANSVIWTAGAVSGARLTNAEFEAIARRCTASPGARAARAKPPGPDAA